MAGAASACLNPSRIHCQEQRGVAGLQKQLVKRKVLGFRQRASCKPGAIRRAATYAQQYPLKLLPLLDYCMGKGVRGIGWQSRRQCLGLKSKAHGVRKVNPSSSFNKELSDLLLAVSGCLVQRR